MAVSDDRVGADGRPAGALQRHHGSALGGDAESGGPVVHVGDPGVVRVVLAGLQGEAAMAGSGQESVEREIFPNRLGPAP